MHFAPSVDMRHCKRHRRECPWKVALMQRRSGIQPQAVVDDHGVLHLIYFKGNP